ncbi:MATE family efflux transporter [Vibrio natriegens]|uniref:Multidrug resistance protein NorM n=1 Tax=Vibrio natriegens NBRC 15636 = ATCC 14048 = DSM 759 TaxID=1219067 RepID=A0AAN0Y5X2_VIBNA|nr:MATE family efflux transporter [Vibrio natriegens]ALR17053.1 multidrug transporter MatE [Vibrio natriegens NBRC 15636 = ATCC 14048 = DSM 759]ANQ13750.1 MATE family efflux transporter [Vibrio natriegens NBRC 15636 = ATCC 14048 = DSM 759]EPM38628.1 multidrug transporter MatE [Vibrio natriegens NBRC 15636 = ATCC 14048 = DSM 759]MDX6028197.1 MATE family efflux transporter [Vibrio natriegens NBRC 15636 = ATCC 14048 = DSM 759]UUI11489.1 MATE family efflux transporter [Vibrio natriegens]
MLERNKPEHQATDKHGLLSAPIPETLRKMTVPMTVGMIAILMFNLVDTFFISLLGTQALAAISYTFPVTFGVNCITMGIGMGLSTNIGRLLGQGHSAQAARFTTHGLLLAVMLVVIASSVGFVTIRPLFGFLGATDDLLPLIEQYMQVWYLTIPLLVIPMAGNSAIRATGDTKTPAKIMMLAGLINGMLDPLLIFGFGPFPELGIQGAAIASAFSWLGALVGSSYLLVKREKLLAKPQWLHLKQDWQQTLKIGTPAAFSTAMTPLSGAILMMLLSSHGTAAVAAYGAAQRIESILILVLMSLTSALTPFMAQNLGANNPQRAFAGLFLSMRFAVVFQGLIFLAMVPLSIPLAALFSQEEAVKNLLWHYLLVVPFSYGFQGIVMILVSGLNAMHKPLRAFQWSFMRLFLFMLPAAWIGSYLYDVEGLFIGIAVGNILGGLLGYMFALRERKLMLVEHSISSS